MKQKHIFYGIVAAAAIGIIYLLLRNKGDKDKGSKAAPAAPPKTAAPAAKKKVPSTVPGPPVLTGNGNAGAPKPAPQPVGAPTAIQTGRTVASKVDNLQAETGTWTGTVFKPDGDHQGFELYETIGQVIHHSPAFVIVKVSGWFSNSYYRVPRGDVYVEK